MLWQVCKNGIPSTHCIVLHLRIYKAPLTVHTNQRRKVWDHSPVWQQYIYPQILSARNRFFELANGRDVRCMICSDGYSLLSTINSILILTIKMVHFITIMNSGGEWGWGYKGVRWHRAVTWEGRNFGYLEYFYRQQLWDTMNIHAVFSCRRESVGWLFLCAWAHHWWLSLLCIVLLTDAIYSS